MAIKRASFQATDSLTLRLDGDDESTHHTNEYRTSISHTSYNDADLTVYSWDWASIKTNFSEVTTEIVAAGTTITGVTLEFWHNLANNAGAIQIEKMAAFNFTTNADSLRNRIELESREIVGSVDILSTSQIYASVNLSDIGHMFAGIKSNIDSDTDYSFVLRRHADYDTSTGDIELGGIELVSGGANWRKFVLGSEIAEPPLLIITYETAAVTAPSFSMRYTTSDASTSQSSPLNSIGGFLSSNEVYTSAAANESINFSQTTIPISGTLPTKTGLASLGPEIFTYAEITSTGLAGVTRGLVPGVAFPGGFDFFGAAESISYLHTDTNGAEKLFNTEAGGSLVQYRCVAIVNESGKSITDFAVGLSHNGSDIVNLKFGVEVPKFDAHSGTAAASTTATVLNTTSFPTASFATGFFNGATIRFASPTEYAVVDSFDNNSFQLVSPGVSGLVSGRTFVILPASSQIVANDTISPGSNSERFSGFFSAGTFLDTNLTEDSNVFNLDDCVYVWIRRTLTDNVEASNITGAVIIIRFRDA